MTKVSVIIPTYNRFNFLLNAVASVREQTYSPIELIIVNDGSTQPEYYTDTLRDVSPEDTIIIHCKQNSSKYIGTVGRAAYARNIGLRMARGEYIAFLDDDDIWLPTKIETQMHEMKKYNCEMSCSDGFIGSGVYDPNKKYPKYLSEYHQDFFNSIGIPELPIIWTKEFLSRHNSCITTSVILSKQIVNMIGIMPYKRVGEDYEYWLRAIQYTNCVFCPEPLIYYDLKHGEGQLY